MTESTYIRIGVRKLELQQTIDDNTNELQYLEFPFEVKHAPFLKKVNPYFTGGLSYFVLQDSKIVNQNNSYNEAAFGINLGLGVETKVAKKLYFNIETNFNYQINPLENTNDIKPYILSLLTGLEYRF